MKFCAEECFPESPKSEEKKSRETTQTSDAAHREGGEDHGEEGEDEDGQDGRVKEYWQDETTERQYDKQLGRQLLQGYACWRDEEKKNAKLLDRIHDYSLRLGRRQHD